MEIRLRLDDEVDKDIIEYILYRANGGPVSKAAYKIMLQFYMLKKTYGRLPEQISSCKIPDKDPKSDSYVYILRGDTMERPCKIGMSKKLSQRLDVLGTKLPFSTELIYFFPCDDAREAEKLLHEEFADKRINGEWFNLNNDEINTIKRITRYEDKQFVLSQEGNTDDNEL